MEEILPGVYEEGGKIYTASANPGVSVYGERTVEKGSREYREWDPRRSKMAALILRGFREVLIKKDSRILYLGAASGTTVSHLSDIAAEGMIFAVEFAAEPFTSLRNLAAGRKNIIPIMGDARHPERYSPLLSSVSLLYQDVAQRDQSDIFLKNAELVKGKGILMLKCRSVDVSASPKKVAETEAAYLRKNGMRIRDLTDLSPLEKDHYAIITDIL